MMVIPGSHHLHMERPAEVAAAIGEFFHADIEARGTSAAGAASGTIAGP
jgi:hypothetical protein